MASAEKSESYWREHHSLPEDYFLDAAIFYGTWPHENKVEPNHIVPLKAELDRTGEPYILRSLGKTSLLAGSAVNYLDHAYELQLPDHEGKNLTTWFVPVEGTRLAGEYVEMARLLRAKQIIILGMCAALLAGMRPGELVMPTEVRPNDTGQSYNARYPTNPLLRLFLRKRLYTRPEEALFTSLQQRVMQHDPDAHIWHTRGYTDEALRRQTREMADKWAAKRFGSVDMEAGLILGAAANPALGTPVPAAALLYVIDNPRLGTAPSESGHLLSVNDARLLQYRVALEEIRGDPIS